MNKKKWFQLLFLPLGFFFIELTAHYYLFGFSLDSSIYTQLLSSIAVGLLISLLVSFLPEKFGKVMFSIIVFIVCAFICAHLIYYAIFHSFFLWNTISIAGDVTAFYREAWEGIVSNWYKIFTTLLPLIIYFFVAKKTTWKMDKRTRGISFAVILLTVGLLITNIEIKDNRKIVNHMQEDSSSTYYQYGMLTSNNIDLYQNAFGVPEDDVDYNNVDPSLRGKTDITMSEGKVVKKNIVDIDFDAMIAATSNSTIKDMHKYFSTKTASEQNEYTGMFEGKNLIVMCLEGFTYKAVSEELTPTLYKMMTQGFYFTNFYDSLWGGSTATGEYSNMTGNFYSSASCLNRSSSTLTYSALGNIFKREGYTNYAYHNGGYEYYSRNKSHPNFGYDKFVANLGGLHLAHSTWPDSDYDLAVATIDDYKNLEGPYQIYYMTISGHCNYSWSANAMSKQHKSEVQSLNYCENVKAYVACQLEVEKMATYICEQLEEAGTLDDTVFVMCCDHYPYALSDEELAELYDLPVKDIRANFDLYRNGLIIWSSSMEEPVIVDTPCSSIDIVPTVANLFGCTFDSRFISGTDILSSSENIAIINTLTSKGGSYNWITEQGTYYTVSKKFVRSEKCTLTTEEEADYVASTTAKVTAMKKYSFAILENDYYKYVFNKDGTAKYPLEQ